MDHTSNLQQFKLGIHNGIPICLGYLAVSFALGILAAESGMTAMQSGVTSFFVLASAGQYAGFTLVGAAGSYLGMAGVMFVANMRYMLMSAALSQKVKSNLPLFHRLLMAWGITDEIFGVAITSPGRLNPALMYGAMAIAIPGWTVGTVLGVLVGNVLPQDLVTALSIGLYGMFIAIIIPPAKKSKIVFGLVAISMIASWLFSRLPVLGNLSEGNRTIILTIIIAGIAAVLFPVPEEKMKDPDDPDAWTGETQQTDRNSTIDHQMIQNKKNRKPAESSNQGGHQDGA